MWNVALILAASLLSQTVDGTSAILDALDKAAVETNRFSAHFSVAKVDPLTEETERRSGEIVLSGQGAQRSAAMVIRQFIDGTGRVEQENRHFVYAKGWLTEYDRSTGHATARQLALADENYDPLRAGEGPIPVPVGQRRSDLEKGFTIAAAAFPDDPMLRGISNVAVLRLTPIEGTECAREISEIVMGWDLTTFLPVAVVAQNKDGGRTIIRFSKSVTNAQVSDASMLLLEPPAPVQGEWIRDMIPKGAS